MPGIQQFVMDAIEKLKLLLTREDRSSDYERTLGNIIQDAFKESPNLARNLLNQTVETMPLEQVAVLNASLSLARANGEPAPPGVEEKIKQRFAALRESIPKGIELEITEQKLQASMQERLQAQQQQAAIKQAPGLTAVVSPQEPEDRQMPT